MNPDLPRLTPGIVKIFADTSYVVNVTEVADQISVTLTDPSGTAVTRQFPYPATNRDLSLPLQAWKVQLISASTGA